MKTTAVGYDELFSAGWFLFVVRHRRAVGGAKFVSQIAFFKADGGRSYRFVPFADLL